LHGHKLGEGLCAGQPALAEFAFELQHPELM
jgi:hypothetical protein